METQQTIETFTSSQSFFFRYGDSNKRTLSVGRSWKLRLLTEMEAEIVSAVETTRTVVRAETEKLSEHLIRVDV